MSDVTNENFKDLVDRACEAACAAIAPTWPLDRSIAVNPHWGRIGRPIRTVAARLALLGGVNVFPARDYIAEAWRTGRIKAEDLREALARRSSDAGPDLDEAACVAALSIAERPEPLPLLIDLLDNNPGREHHLPWRQAITHQVSQTCAAYFDEHQADWRPQRHDGLYAFWRDTLVHDHGIGILMGLPGIGRQIERLPSTPADAERWALKKLDLPPAVWADYLEAVLLTVNGWASWCAYRKWQAGLSGGTDSNLRELLAIRLAWGTVLLEGELSERTQASFAELRAEWSRAAEALRRAEKMLAVDEVWQVALEIGYQRGLAHALTKTPAVETGAAAPAPIKAQAAFCIDVRSEPLRRAVERSAPGVHTIGFAGFFGLPIAYTPLGTAARRPQLPGLLPAALDVRDAVGDASGLRAAENIRHQRFSNDEQWACASRWPAAAFSFVEAFGWIYGKKLGRWLRVERAPRRRDDVAGLPADVAAVCRPSLSHLDVGARVTLAARVLHAMGLEGGLAPTVLLIGHGGQSANNPHAAGLDCGACCGQTGEVNARVLAELLNDAGVRAGLAAEGIVVPADTRFVAALHNTTTDELEWFDLDLLPPASVARVDALKVSFARALDAVRRERAPRLGLDASLESDDLLMRLQRRANDGAQTRPEWGLAGNAAFVIAPRARTRGLNLGGRIFLHDYDVAKDADGAVLELLMTAPMLVTNWINWQYHASTCEPRVYGSGNKVLHNVVGGNIGVFEGNGGDLRIGLSRQSLHDGRAWVHEPLRLTVVIDAPRENIRKVIDKHAVVRQLLDNGWLHLWHLGAGDVTRYVDGRWEAEIATSACS